MNTLMKRNGKRKRFRASGITLLELILSMSLAVVMLSSLFILYYTAARGSAKESNLSTAYRDTKITRDKITRHMRLTGLLAPLDCDGTADDIKRDVPNQTWSDSVRHDFEAASNNVIVFDGDIDNDGKTETVKLTRNTSLRTLEEQTWKWSRDSLRWLIPITRTIATNVDYILFRYYDHDGNAVPPAIPAPTYNLTAGERVRITMVEVTVVTRSDQTDSGTNAVVTVADGTTWNDHYKRVAERFMIRGRNLSLGA
jgi:hypothetical protein